MDNSRLAPTGATTVPTHPPHVTIGPDPRALPVRSAGQVKCLRVKQPRVTRGERSRPWIWLAVAASAAAANRGALSLHVSETLDDLPVPDAHDVYPANLVRFVLAPTQPPADNPAILAGPDFFGCEDEIRRGCEPFPEIETGRAALVARTIRSGSGIFENASFADQVVKVLRATLFKRVIETFENFAGGFAVGIHLFTSRNGALESCRLRRD